MIGFLSCASWWAGQSCDPHSFHCSQLLNWEMRWLEYSHCICTIFPPCKQLQSLLLHCYKTGNGRGTGLCCLERGHADSHEGKYGSLSSEGCDASGLPAWVPPLAVGWNIFEYLEYCFFFLSAKCKWIIAPFKTHSQSRAFITGARKVVKSICMPLKTTNSSCCTVY